MRWDCYHHSHFTDMKIEAQKGGKSFASNQLGSGGAGIHRLQLQVLRPTLCQILAVHASFRVWLFVPSVLTLCPCFCLSKGLKVWGIVREGKVTETL